MSFGDMYEPENEGEIYRKHGGCSDETLLFADGAEDKVGVLFGHIFELCLSAVEKSFSGDAARTDGNLRLVDVIAGSSDVFLDSERHLDTHLLMRLENVVENIVNREKEKH